MTRRIYLDNNAGTLLDSRLVELILKELEEGVGNPSSLHSFGRIERRALDKSRSEIAKFFHVKPNEVIFTSGGTEGASLLLRGALQGRSGVEVISTEAEHSAVYHTLLDLSKKGAEVTFLPVGVSGAPSLECLEKAITPKTALIALMAVNNETGVKTDIEGVAAMAKRHDIPLVVDGVAWLGKEKIVIPSGVAAIFFSGHKIHAPKGVGFCILRSSFKLSPLFVGGQQEFNRRAGTENMSGIVALAGAIALLDKEQERTIAEMTRLRDLFESELGRRLPNVRVNGLGPRVCNTSNLAFMGVDGEALLIQLDLEGVAASHGSACAAGAMEPSRVLLAMGIPLDRVRSSLRFSLSRQTTEAEILYAVGVIERVVKSRLSAAHREQGPALS